MRYAALALIPVAVLSAQATKPAASKDKNTEAQNARVLFKQSLDAVNGTWFGNPYKDVTATQLQGNLEIALTAQAINAKVDDVSQGQVKGSFAKGGKVALKVKGTYFANGDFRTELGGDFGNLLYTRVGQRGFLYSKEQNSYTTRVDAPPTNAPLTYLGWFRQCLNDIQAVYVDGNSFKAAMGKEDTVNGRSTQALVFSSPTAAYDPKKREQSIDDSLNFWKRGRMEVSVDKETKVPLRMVFSNEAQGVHTRMDFVYNKLGRIQSLSMSNQSKGMEGPGSLTINYGGDGLISSVGGELSGQNKRIGFNFGLNWVKDLKSSTIVSVPPPGAAKKGRDELESLLMVTLAGELLELQRNGLNLRSVSLTRK
jgi:hypothetical protein